MRDRADMPRAWRRLAAALFACLVVLGAGAASAAEDLQSQLAETNQKLDQAEDRKGVLTSRISAYDERIAELRAEVAALREREARVAAELADTKAELIAARDELNRLREELGHSMRELRSRLIEIYKSGETDALSVILDSEGFDDLVTRYDYLDRIQDRDATIVDRVRELRDESIATVAVIRASRDRIAAKQAELERTRAAVEERQAELDAVRAEQAALLGDVQGQIRILEGDLSDIQGKIEAELAASASTTTSDPVPYGPVQGGSGSMIWPINGILTSPFGMRWGRLHAGIDIAAPSGTPIHAAKAGHVVMAQYYGGYGNYTCIDHGGGLSTCYGHQSAFGTSAGADVGQGEVIGYVGTTGSSTGNHLHFEVRVNGTPVDPMGYLN